MWFILRGATERYWPNELSKCFLHYFRKSGLDKGVARIGHQYIETHLEEVRRREWVLLRLDTIK